MPTLEQIAQVFVVIVPSIFAWIKAAFAGDEAAAREAQYKTANAIADEVERAKFGGRNVGG